MLFPSLLAIAVPVLVGLIFGVPGVMGLLVGGLASGFVLAVFMANAGGAWDNAKKSFEKGVNINGEMFYKKSEPHKASVTGDTVGDPFKDTSGPSMNILIKLMSIVSLVIAPYIAVTAAESEDACCSKIEKVEVIKCNINGVEYTCKSIAECDSIISANAVEAKENKIMNEESEHNEEAHSTQGDKIGHTH